MNTGLDVGDEGHKMFLKCVLRHNKQRLYTRALADSGCKHNLISYDTLVRMNCKKLNITAMGPDGPKLECPSGEALKMIGCVNLSTKIGNNEYYLSFYIVNSLVTGIILGSDEMSKMDAKIRFKDHKFLIGDEEIQLFPANVCSTVNSCSERTIKPGEIVTLQTRPLSDYPVGGTCILEPVSREGLDIFSSLVEVGSRKLPSVVIHNVSEKKYSDKEK